MKTALIAGGAIVAVVGLVALVVLYVAFLPKYRSVAPTPTAITLDVPPAKAAQPTRETQGFLYGRITTIDGVSYEGRLRWGGDQEASWGDYFNGVKKENPWLPQVPVEQRPKESSTVEIFGIKIAHHERLLDVGRRFMSRFGDIARIEGDGGDVRVTLKSGTVFDLNRLDASDFDDGVRVWDATRGAVDLDSRRIRTIELLPTPQLAAAPARLHGTVRTRHGDFTGFVQWNRQACLGSDELEGRTPDGKLRVRFDAIRSIARSARNGFMVTLVDGREIALSAPTRGIYVDDPRYGRVLVSWNAFERLDFDPGGSGPSYGAFPPGRSFTGTVTTRAGNRLTGRLVYDLDESETTETFDAPSEGVDYAIPFGLIASIASTGRVRLVSGEELQLERRSDLGEGNAGVLIFAEGREKPDYVPWSDVAEIDFD